MTTHHALPRITLACTIVAALSVLLVPQLAVAQPGNPNLPLPVTVVNPAPLPVTGSIDIGTGGSVTVANPETSPVPVRDVGETGRNHFRSERPSLVSREASSP